MSCNSPFLGIPGEMLPSGKRKINILGRYDVSMLQDYPDAVKVPCGKCSGCRAQKTREWADRMILELDHSGTAVFLTLTYDDEHLPMYYNQQTAETVPTLRKRDLQLFMKRLRKRKEFKGRELRYYACGEYGSTTHRPHMHMILYNVSLDDFKDLAPRGTNELNQPYFSSDILAKEVWKNGFCLIAPVSWSTCAYVARYVKKKKMGLVSDEYVERMYEPEFSVMSRNPGIGMYYPVEHPDFKEKSKYYFADQNGSVQVNFPKAFLRFLENTDLEYFMKIKEERKIMANDIAFNRVIHTNLSGMELDGIAEKKIEKTSDLLDFYRTQV